jgi:hypothetical protein
MPRRHCNARDLPCEPLAPDCLCRLQAEIAAFNDAMLDEDLAALPVTIRPPRR